VLLLLDLRGREGKERKKSKYEKIIYHNLINLLNEMTIDKDCGLEV